MMNKYERNERKLELKQLNGLDISKEKQFENEMIIEAIDEMYAYASILSEHRRICEKNMISHTGILPADPILKLKKRLQYFDYLYHQLKKEYKNSGTSKQLLRIMDDISYISSSIGFGSGNELANKYGDNHKGLYHKCRFLNIPVIDDDNDFHKYFNIWVKYLRESIWNLKIRLHGNKANIYLACLNISAVSGEKAELYEYLYRKYETN